MTKAGPEVAPIVIGRTERSGRVNDDRDVVSLRKRIVPVQIEIVSERCVWNDDSDLTAIPREQFILR